MWAGSACVTPAGGSDLAWIEEVTGEWPEDCDPTVGDEGIDAATGTFTVTDGETTLGSFHARGDAMYSNGIQTLNGSLSGCRLDDNGLIDLSVSLLYVVDGDEGTGWISFHEVLDEHPYSNARGNMLDGEGHFGPQNELYTFEDGDMHIQSSLSDDSGVAGTAFVTGQVAVTVEFDLSW